MSLNALSVDLEEYFQVSNSAGVIERKKWADLPSRVGAATHPLLDSFDTTASRATFFVRGRVAERHPGLVLEFSDRGHEIACHGYGHELVYEIGPERSRDDLKRAQSAITEATGVQPRGYRAPSYSITDRSLWSLDILTEEGFDYDSSIAPIHLERSTRAARDESRHVDAEGSRNLWDNCLPLLDFSISPSRIGALVRRSLDTFDRATSGASYFVLRWIAERRPALVREIALRFVGFRMMTVAAGLLKLPSIQSVGRRMCFEEISLRSTEPK
jgi:hypothetical protein